MQAFEQYFRNRLKSSGVYFLNTTHTKNLCDFIVFSNKTPCFLELKNYKNFSVESWVKKQPKQFELFNNCHTYFLIICEQTNNFNDLEIYNKNLYPNFKKIKNFLTYFDKGC